MLAAFFIVLEMELGLEAQTRRPTGIYKSLVLETGNILALSAPISALFHCAYVCKLALSSTAQTERKEGRERERKRDFQ